MRAPPRVVRALASSARAPTLAAMATASSGAPRARPPPPREAARHPQQVLREGPEPPRPLRRRPGPHQPYRLLLGVQRGGVAEHLQAACQPLGGPAGPVGG